MTAAGVPIAELRSPGAKRGTLLLHAAREVRCVREHGGDGAFLFLAARQQMFHAPAALHAAWSLIEHGVPQEVLVDRLAEAGCDGREMIDRLIDMGAIERLTGANGANGLSSAMTVRIGDFSILLGFETATARRLVFPAFAHLETQPGPVMASITISEDTSGFLIACAADLHGPLAANELVPSLKVVLTDAYLRRSELLVLHAATLVRNGRALLVLGDPGAGKSTLALFADAAGPFQLAGDDIAELRPDGGVRPVPFAATVKRGAWPLLLALRPELADQPAHLRPDGKTVKYLPPVPATTDRHKVSWIIELARRPGACAALSPLSIADTFRASLAGAWSHDRKVSAASFDALHSCISRATRYRLTYSDLCEAVQLMDELTLTTPDLPEMP